MAVVNPDNVDGQTTSSASERSRKMAVANPENAHSQTTSSASPEAGDDFYIGRFPDAKGWIDSQSVRFWGYIAFYGHIDESNTLRITSLEPVALSETLFNSDDKSEFIGLSLTGPLYETTELDQNVYKLDMQLEYFNMEKQHDDYQEDEPMFPEVQTTLTLAPVDISDRNKLQLAMTLKSKPVASDERWGKVPQVSIDTPVEITFARVEPKRIDWEEADSDDHPNVQRSRNPGQCWQVQAKPPGWFQKANNKMYELHVVFLLFSEKYDLENQVDKAFIESLCRTQLTYVCKAWWHLCALKVVVWPNPPNDPVGNIQVFAGDKAKAEQLGLNYADKTYVNQVGNAITNTNTNPNHRPCLEICLVDKIANPGPHPWAGGTYNITGANLAYCLLDIEQAVQYSYLLAHELGHALRLNDSDGASLKGSPGSIMDINFVTLPNKPQPDNTANNVGLFKEGRRRYSIIVEPTGVDAFFFTVDPLP